MATVQFKAVFLGDSGVGKTSIMQRFVHGTFDNESQSTIGAAFSMKTVEVGNKTVKFNIWDTAGQERYRSLTKMYYRDAAVAIIVLDLSKPPSLTSIELWKQDLDAHGPKNISLAIAGNKLDLGGGADHPAEAWAKQHSAIYLHTSAKSGAGIAELFELIGQRLLSSHPGHTRSSSLLLSIKENKQKRKCCAGGKSRKRT